VKKGILFSSFLFSLLALHAQTTDSISVEMKDVVITGLKEVQRTETVMNVTPVTATEMTRSGSFNISDALSKLPGITQLTTGLAISKPVIHGLYGNRILTLLSGLRFDNQQWQDEHGMGLSDIGIDRVEVIKGPMAVLYGTDAVGGLINVIEEQKPAPGTIAVDFNTRFHTNTLGTLTDAGVRGNKGKLWWRVRLGAESHADYSDGNNTRVLNSRSDGYYAKATVGFRKENVVSENTYHFSMNDYGFILGDIRDFMEPDARYTRKLNGPFHNVIFNVLSSRNAITLKNSLLKIDAGFQSNSRKENEGGGKISLDMLLSTLLYHLEWIKPINSNFEFILSQNTSYENNTNFGARKLIPDAHIAEGSLGGFLKYRIDKVIIEAGVGLNTRYIKTLETPLVNTPDRDIHPFTRFKVAGNGLIGATINPTEGLNIKINAATGLRAPNLAELSSNGLREGTLHYEIGDPTLKNEQNINMDVSVTQVHRWFGYSASVYVNLFSNFIYLAPTAETLYGFNIYRWKQHNTTFMGVDGELELTPQGPVRGLKLAVAGSYLYSVTDIGEYIPFTPAPNVSPSVSYTRNLSKKVKGFFVKAGVNYVFAQNRLAPEEKPTPKYYLLNASAGAEFLFKKGRVVISVVGSNLLNRAYFDHLSRLKEFGGINNIGRNITLNISIPLTFKYSLTKNNN